MATYRVFILGDDDHFVGSEVIDCPTDSEAMSHAPSVGGAHKAVEVWDLKRLVGHINLRHPAMEDRLSVSSVDHSASAPGKEGGLSPSISAAIAS